MLAWTVAAALSLGASPDPKTDPGRAFVFDLNAVPRVTVQITVEEWNRLLELFDRNPRNETLVRAALVFEKGDRRERLPAIGFRVRGNHFSRRRPEGKTGEPHNPAKPSWHQAHFKLDFNHFVPGQRFFGMDSLNLKFFNGDPSHVREVFAYDLFRRFGVWTAPLASYARLRIQVGATRAELGVYEMVEHVDDRFLEVRFGKEGATGDLWKCLHQNQGPADLRKLPADSPKIGIEDIQLDEKKSKRPSYDLKTNEGQLDAARNRLLAFLEALNDTPDAAFGRWLEETMDVDQLLRALAANVLLGMWDDYWVNGNNYYLYFHPDGRVYFIPYDYDNTLGTSFLVFNSGTQDIFQWGPIDLSRPLARRIMLHARLRERYAGHIRALLAPERALLDPAAAVRRVRDLQSRIARFVENDTGTSQELEDVPPAWSQRKFYRLLTGDDRGLPPEANYFKTRARFAEEQLRRAGFYSGTH